MTWEETSSGSNVICGGGSTSKLRKLHLSKHLDSRMPFRYASYVLYDAREGRMRERAEC